MSVREERRELFRIDGSTFGIEAEVHEYEGGDGRQYASGSVTVSQVFGGAPSVFDMFAALWLPEDGWGEWLRDASDRAHLTRCYPWRVDISKGMSGRVDIRVREQDEKAKEWGTAGKISSHVHISCAWKLNQGLHVQLKDWNAIHHAILRDGSADVERLRKLYTGKKIQRVPHGMEFEDWTDGGMSLYDGDWTDTFSDHLKKAVEEKEAEAARMAALVEGEAEDAPVHEPSEEDLSAVRKRLHELYEGEDD
ncbi:MAG: hypothetical protein IJR14_08255 [Synergistaceae bacterium]|nr:hypothetical protein [Synergistaceae bacterium]